jgi:stress-induced morphogen
MAIDIRDDQDEILDAVGKILRVYEDRHPRARIEAYRRDSASIRIRIIDPDFEGLDRAKRHGDVWRLLDELPEDVLSHLSLLLLLTPKEKKTSFASYEFDHPVPAAP